MRKTAIQWFPGSLASEVERVLRSVEADRKEASEELDPRQRARMGQFMTPARLAAFMAGMFDCKVPSVRILDPGAGIGSLSAALVCALCRRRTPPAAISVTAYEIDPTLLKYLRATLQRCCSICEAAGVAFQAEVIAYDFLESGANQLAGGLFSDRDTRQFDCAILNPPYRKIATASRERNLLRSIGLETTNIYAGFVGITARLLAPGGELVAITPRSFCNGPYFQPFRRHFLREMRFRRVHLFDSRDRAFADDSVLQENVIFHARRSNDAGEHAIVSASHDPTDTDTRMRTIKHDELVRPDDRDAVIHIVPNADGDAARDRIANLAATLVDLGLIVSTGRVVDFRAKHWLRREPAADTVPLIYPCHLSGGFVEWPNGNVKKPNALMHDSNSERLLVPQGYYVLTKRFTAKEERRRLVAAIYDPTRVSADAVAFENHLNYFHADGRGLSVTLAKGLAAFLNSTAADTYFRQFSGHTQVNAADLRSLRYPQRTTLIALGRRIGTVFPLQDALDDMLEDLVFRG